MRCAAVILRREFHLEGRAGSVLWSPTGCAMHCCWAVCQMLSSLTQKQQLYHNPLTLPCSQSPILSEMHLLFFNHTYTLLFTFSRKTNLLQCTSLLLRGSCVLRYLMYEEFRRKKQCLVLVFHEVTTWRNQAGQQYSNVLQTLTIFSVYTAHNIITVIWIWNYANEKGSHDSQ